MRFIPASLSPRGQHVVARGPEILPRCTTVPRVPNAGALTPIIARRLPPQPAYHRGAPTRPSLRAYQVEHPHCSRASAAGERPIGPAGQTLFSPHYAVVLQTDWCISTLAGMAEGAGGVFTPW